MIKKLVIILLLILTLPLMIFLGILTTINETIGIISFMLSGKNFIDSMCLVVERKIETAKRNIEYVEKYLGR